MELLLWFWLNDPRWFFNLEISIVSFRRIIFVPILSNLIILLLIVYTYQYYEANENNCNRNLIVWLLSRALINILIIVVCSILILKAYKTEVKEKMKFKNICKINKYVKKSIDEYDYWIKQKCLFSTIGILFLILSLVIVFWACMLSRMVFLNNASCIWNYMLIIKIDIGFTLISNFPVALAFVSLFVCKIFSLIFAFVCPGFLAKLSKIFKYIEFKSDYIKKIHDI